MYISIKSPSSRSLIERLNLNESLVSDQTGCSSKETCFISFWACAGVCKKKTITIGARSDTYVYFFIKAFKAKKRFFVIPTEYGFYALLVREIFYDLLIRPYMDRTSHYDL